MRLCRKMKVAVIKIAQKLSRGRNNASLSYYLIKSWSPKSLSKSFLSE